MDSNTNDLEKTFIWKTDELRVSMMRETHKECLKRNYTTLAENTTNLPKILNKLLTEDIVTVNEKIKILAILVPDDQVTALVDLIMMRKSDYGFHVLMNALQSTNPHVYAHLLKWLEENGDHSSYQESIKDSVSGSSKPVITPGPYTQRKMSSSLSPQATLDTNRPTVSSCSQQVHPTEDDEGSGPAVDLVHLKNCLLKKHERAERRYKAIQHEFFYLFTTRFDLPDALRQLLTEVLNNLRTRVEELYVLDKEGFLEVARDFDVCLDLALYLSKGHNWHAFHERACKLSEKCRVLSEQAIYSHPHFSVHKNATWEPESHTTNGDVSNDMGEDQAECQTEWIAEEHTDAKSTLSDDIRYRRGQGPDKSKEDEVHGDRNFRVMEVIKTREDTAVRAPQDTAVRTSGGDTEGICGGGRKPGWEGEVKAAALGESIVGRARSDSVDSFFGDAFDDDMEL